MKHITFLFNCDNCDDMFNLPINLGNKKRVTPQYFHCDICDECFESVDNPLNHRIRQQNKAESQQTEYIKCHICE